MSKPADIIYIHSILFIATCFPVEVCFELLKPSYFNKFTFKQFNFLIEFNKIGYFIEHKFLYSYFNTHRNPTHSKIKCLCF